MKIYVIGTSNSVMQNGWVYGLSSNKNNNVINLSSGRTPVFMHIAQIIMHMKELKKADLIILDHSINDINFYIPSVGKDYYDSIKDLLAIASSINKPVVNILFPILDIKKRNHATQAIKYIINLCNCYNLYYIDFNSFRIHSKYYENSIHLKREVAYFIGLELSRILSEYKFETIDEQILLNNPYRVVSCHKLARSHEQIKIDTFKNSLGVFSFLKLDQEIDLSEYSGCKLMAIAYFNEANKTHTFSVQTENETVSYRTTDNKFFIEMLNSPILIDNHSNIQKSKSDIRNTPCLMGRDEKVNSDIIGANISYLLLKSEANVVLEQKDTKLYPNITPLIVETIEKLEYLFYGLLDNKEINTIRDAALFSEKSKMPLALNLMKIAHRLRPKGLLIIKKLRTYRSFFEHTG